MFINYSATRSISSPATISVLGALEGWSFKNLGKKKGLRMQNIMINFSKIIVHKTFPKVIALKPSI